MAPRLGQFVLKLGQSELQTGDIVLVFYPQAGELLTVVLLK